MSRFSEHLRREISERDRLRAEESTHLANIFAAAGIIATELSLKDIEPSFTVNSLQQARESAFTGWQIVQHAGSTPHGDGKYQTYTSDIRGLLLTSEGAIIGYRATQPEQQVATGYAIEAVAADKLSANEYVLAGFAVPDGIQRALINFAIKMCIDPAKFE